MSYLGVLGQYGLALVDVDLAALAELALEEEQPGIFVSGGRRDMGQWNLGSVHGLMPKLRT